KMQSCLEKCSLQSDIMRMNVDKVLERDQKLSELDNRADALQAGASQFETKSIHCRHYFHLHLIGFCLQKFLYVVVVGFLPSVEFLVFTFLNTK
uniref:V-SNARE coiled-coil homology domain-containing protein n=1 Tax=Calidris pygmaea TaxID=425635 RepID=A0A8C3JKH5_9CHAR